MSEKNVSKMLFSNQEPQKIELALDGQLKDIEQKAQSIFNDGRRDALQEVLNASGKMEATSKRLQKLQNEIDKAYTDGKRLAKEIGVDLESTTVGKNFKKAFQDVEDYIISVDSFISKLRKFKL
jgi:F0F1-type ATP synthase membrane subunit b/b'|tara:strand:- start:12880 stop:13251 length:372 start_codon:yes stop_codon:yes gene_type:complete